MSYLRSQNISFCASSFDSSFFGKLEKGDCISFFAEAYRYVKTSDGKKLEFGLRNPQRVKKIEKSVPRTIEPVPRVVKAQQSVGVDSSEKIRK